MASVPSGATLDAMGENQLVCSSYPLEILSIGARVTCVKVVNKWAAQCSPCGPHKA